MSCFCFHFCLIFSVTSISCFASKIPQDVHVFVLILLRNPTLSYCFFKLSFLAHKNDRGGLSEIKALLEKLPASNYQLLKYLCNFLVKVSMNEGEI